MSLKRGLEEMGQGMAHGDSLSQEGSAPGNLKGGASIPRQRLLYLLGEGSDGPTHLQSFLSVILPTTVTGLLSPPAAFPGFLAHPKPFLPQGFLGATAPLELTFRAHQSCRPQGSLF